MFEVVVNGKKWFSYKTLEEAEAKAEILRRHMNAKIEVEHIRIGGWSGVRS